MGNEIIAFAQRVYKPGSVFVWPSLWEAGYLATLAIYREGPRAASTPPFDLAPDGVCQAGVLPHRRCALTAPFHRYRRTVVPRLCVFCGTFRRVAPPGRYPASCPMEPGLSSAPTKCSRMQRPPDPLRTFSNTEFVFPEFLRGPIG